eukprot:COSAG01_NODE_1760_length_9301_cov_8.687242_3_plen_139_part_00
MKFSACQSCVIQALLLEKIGETSLAMEYIVYCLEEDPSKGGGEVGWLRILAYRCRGRLLANMGQRDDAEAAFESAAALAEQRGYWMFEAMAVCDMITYVFGPAGQRQSGLRRLQPLVRRLGGTSVELAEILGEEYVSF